MPVPDDEDLFRFIASRDYDQRPDGTGKLRSTFYSQSTPVSMNLGSIWDLAQHRRVCPKGYGLCSVQARGLRGVWNQDAKPPKDAVEIIPKPVDPDPLLNIANPAHSELNRRLSDSESRKAVALAFAGIHWLPDDQT